MPDFSLTEEQQAFRRLAHEFAVHEIFYRGEYDRTAESPFTDRKAHEVGGRIECPGRVWRPASASRRIADREELSWGCTVFGSLGINTIATLPCCRRHSSRSVTIWDVSSMSASRSLASRSRMAVRMSPRCRRRPAVGEEYVLKGPNKFITNASYGTTSFRSHGSRRAQ